MSYADAIFGYGKHTSTLGPKGRIGAAAVPQFPPPPSKATAMKNPPHVCTAGSALRLAQQIEGGGWTYAGTTSIAACISGTHYTVTMPDGSSKTIPAWFTKNPNELVLACPYTHETFLFRR
jgi:hypothetical protein